MLLIKYLLPSVAYNRTTLSPIFIGSSSLYLRLYILIVVIMLSIIDDDDDAASLNVTLIHMGWRVHIKLSSLMRI